MCMIDMADERVTVISERIGRARKQHKCDECSRRIEPGEQYLAEFYKSDGRTENHKTCSHCQVVRKWLNDECGGWIYGGVEEDIREHSWEGHGIRVKMMAVGMERYWRRRDGRMWPIPRLPKTTHELMSN